MGTLMDLNTLYTNKFITKRTAEILVRANWSVQEYLQASDATLREELKSLVGKV